MKYLVLILFSTLIPITLCDLEKGWKGIRVLESSRSDVEKILGRPVEDEHGVVKYSTDEGNFRFLFSGAPCSGLGALLGDYNVKKDTVLQYQFQPKNQLSLSDLRWDKDLYERADDAHLAKNVNYYNPRDAIRLTTYRINGETEIVRMIYFERTADQNAKFGCKKGI